MTVKDADTGRTRHLVINAINLSVGGGRTVLRAFLGALLAQMPPDLLVTCFVRQSDDLPAGPSIAYVVPRLPRNSWLARLWFENVGLARALSGRGVDIFVSLQGSGARVDAPQRFVYCHNALPLVTIPPGAFDGARQLRMMRQVYDLLYRFTIRRGDWLIVQQAWVREAFCTRYGHCRAIVAHPIDATAKPAARVPVPSGTAVPFKLLYPLAAHPYKNAQVACDAAVALEAAHPGRFELTLTIRGDETFYAADLLARYGHCPAIRFAGALTHERLLMLYREVDLLVFPSLVETWGLPISEAKAAGLPILVADLPYAYETIGDCTAAGFFNPLDAAALAEAIRGCWTGERPLGAVTQPPPEDPFAPDWKALVAFVIADRRGQDPSF